MSDDLHLTFTKQGVLDTLHIADRVLVEQVEGGQGYEVTIWHKDGSSVGISVLLRGTGRSARS